MLKLQKELLSLMNIKDSVKTILSDKKAKHQGLHVKHIARHILNMNNNLFANESLSYEALKTRVDKIQNKKVKTSFSDFQCVKIL